MAFIRAKEIPPGSGNWYDYEVKDYREGDKVKQRVIRYIGKSSRIGTNNGGEKMGSARHDSSVLLGTTSNYEPVVRIIGNKKMTWLSQFMGELEVTSGPGMGKYQIDVESYEQIPFNGLVDLGKRIQGKVVKARVEDIGEFLERYKTTPRAIRDALRGEREMLVLEINGLLEEQQRRRDKWFEDEGKTTSLPEYNTPKVKAAREKLAEFDISHPEILEAIKKEKKEQTERHIWD